MSIVYQKLPQSIIDIRHYIYKSVALDLDNKIQKIKLTLYLHEIDR